jgi:hypothetical protein
MEKTKMGHVKYRTLWAVWQAFQQARQCEHCHASLSGKRLNKRYCSNACRQAAYRDRRYDYAADRRRNRNASTQLAP